MGPSSLMSESSRYKLCVLRFLSPSLRSPKAISHAWPYLSKLKPTEWVAFVLPMPSLYMPIYPYILGTCATPRHIVGSGFLSRHSGTGPFNSELSCCQWTLTTGNETGRRQADKCSFLSPSHELRRASSLQLSREVPMCSWYTCGATCYISAWLVTSSSQDGSRSPYIASRSSSPCLYVLLEHPHFNLFPRESRRHKTS